MTPSNLVDPPVPTPAPAALAAVFRRRGWLSEQPPKVQAAFLAQGRTLALAGGATVFRDGDPPGGIFGVITGGVGSFSSNRRGGPVLGHILRPGDWFGPGPVLRLRPRTLTFVAVEPSWLLHLDLAALAALRDVLPETERYLGSLAIDGALIAARALVDVLMPEADRRIAATLLRVTAVEEGIAAADPGGFALAQAQLGEMANVSRKHVNLILLRFQAQGWLRLGYRRIAILDPAALHRLAAGA